MFVVVVVDVDSKNKHFLLVLNPDFELYGHKFMRR